MKQLDSSLNEANADFAEQQAALTEAVKAQQFAIAEDKQMTAKVETLAKQLKIPEEGTVRVSSLTIKSTAPTEPKVGVLPGSVSATPVFLRALEGASKQAELEVGVTEGEAFIYGLIIRYRAATSTLCCLIDTACFFSLRTLSH